MYSTVRVRVFNLCAFSATTDFHGHRLGFLLAGSAAAAALSYVAHTEHSVDLCQAMDSYILALLSRTPWSGPPVVPPANFRRLVDSYS